MPAPSHYEVLSISQSLLDESKADQIYTLVKQAYHRALLRHHPDKAHKKPTGSFSSPTPSSSSNSTFTAFTIDQVTAAYITLSQFALRVEYDAHLRTLPTNDTTSAFQTGVETLDLDDLASEEDSSDGTTTWSKSCRCGNERGFVVGERDLEEASDVGELVVGCQDCSLRLRVCFAMFEEKETEVPGEPDRTVEQSLANETGRRQHAHG